MNRRTEASGALTRLSGLCRAHPVGTVVLALILARALLPAAWTLPTDNSPEVFYPEDHEDLETLGRLRTLFGGDRTLRVLVTGEALWTRRGLTTLGELEDRLQGLPGVADAVGLPRALGDESWPPDAPGDLRGRAESSPLARAAGWIGRDGAASSILVYLRPEARAGPLVEAVAGIAESPRRPSLDLQVLGLPVLEHALDRSSREIPKVFFPLLVTITTLLLALALGKWRETIVGLLFVAFCLVLVLGGFGLAGGTMNLVLAVLPPVLFVIALGTAVHLLIRFRDLRDRGRDTTEAVRQTMVSKGRAVFWTGATTMVGFGSLVTGRVEPIRTLGLTAALGIAGITLAAFCLVPALLRLVAGGGQPAGQRSFEEAARHVAGRAAGLGLRKTRTVVGVALGILLLAGFGIPRLEIASDALTFLPSDDPLRRAVRESEVRGIPAAAVELLLRRPEGAFGAKEIRRLQELTENIEEHPGVFTALSAGTLLSEARRRAGGADIPDALLLRALRTEPRGRELLARLLASDRGTARITVGVPVSGFQALDRTVERVRSEIEEGWPELEVSVTGELPLLLEAQRSLLETLGWSLGLSLLVIGGIFLGVLGSLRLALVALVPNLWPVILVLGLMGWLGIPLDIATVMVAAVILGLAVDDTIHTLLEVERRQKDEEPEAAITSSLETNGPAYTLTSTLLATGFGVCVLSDFAPTSRFGGLAGLAMVLVWVGALWILPALLATVAAPDEGGHGDGRAE